MTRSVQNTLGLAQNNFEKNNLIGINMLCVLLEASVVLLNKKKKQLMGGVGRILNRFQ